MIYRYVTNGTLKLTSLLHSSKILTDRGFISSVSSENELETLIKKFDA